MTAFEQTRATVRLRRGGPASVQTARAPQWHDLGYRIYHARAWPTSRWRAQLAVAMYLRGRDLQVGAL
jgi:hypothetical protein